MAFTKGKRLMITEALEPQRLCVGPCLIYVSPSTAHFPGAEYINARIYIEMESPTLAQAIRAGNHAHKRIGQAEYFPEFVTYRRDVKDVFSPEKPGKMPLFEIEYGT